MTNLTVEKPELLLPAGSPEKLRYAVAYGGDAVYLGLPMASLRTPSRGDQFTPDNLAEHIDYARERGVKSYVTLNIFASNHDIKRLIPHLEQLEDIKPAGLIISDPGIMRLAKKHAPSVPLHISTQANTLNVEACAFWQDYGAERVILAREVPLREIAQIHDALPDLEIEAFIHGSLCVAYSGRCVISDYLTDNTKNSNKGMCGNSCRWEFNEAETELQSLKMAEATRPNDVYTFEEDQHGTYMLNSRDLCLVEHLRKLQDAGVCSFKAEGRTKSVFYVSTVAQVYREAIDYFQTHEKADEETLARWSWQLSQAGNRGFTEGFLNGRPNDTAYNYQSSTSQQGSLFLATAEGGVNVDDRLAVRVKNSFALGDTLEWMSPGHQHTFTVETLYNEKGQPVDAAKTNQLVYVSVPDALKQANGLEWSIMSMKHRNTVNPEVALKNNVGHAITHS